MGRRLKQIVLPIIVMLVVTVVVLLVLLGALRVHFKTAQNAEIAGIVGEITAANTEIDASALVEALSKPVSARDIRQGEELLKQYGYQEEDFTSLAAQNFVECAFATIVVVVCVFAIVIIAYFWLRDLYEQKQIEKLVEYLHMLDSQIHDLKLTENAEGQLSILTNELYKIMITLKTAALSNQEGRKNLETALADISHQLRTPLTSLQIMIDNIYNEPDMPVAVRQDFLQSIARQIEQMSSLITTLLNIAKFDNKTIKMNSSIITAGDLLTQVLQKLEVLADLNGITLEVSGDLTAKVKLDARWQSEALSNIIKNCLEHSTAGSKIIITAQNCPLFLKITIQDFGEGIAKQDLRHIFERFYKAKNSAQTSVGIGLSFAKTIIEADNGQIAVKSEEGVGTQFVITYFK